MTLELVPLVHVDEIWKHVASGMERACARSGGGVSAPWLFGECRAGRALLFAVCGDKAVHAALVARVEERQGGRVLNILMACGHGMGRWLDIIRQHRDWPVRLGVSTVAFEGRPGWRRVLPEARVVRHVYQVEL